MLFGGRGSSLRDWSLPQKNNYFLRENASLIPKPNPFLEGELGLVRLPIVFMFRRISILHSSYSLYVTKDAKIAF